MNKIDTIIFVYNVDSSFFAQATAYVQKFIPASSNVCNLCHLTYGKRGMEIQWKQFIKNLPFKVIIMHRDEFRQKFPSMDKITIPTIMVEKDNKTTELLSTKGINTATTIDQLIKLINEKLRARI